MLNPSHELSRSIKGALAGGGDPATSPLYVLLWTLICATILRFGFRLPSWDWAAFSSASIGVTLGGYARILALVTGIEILASLVAAYEGPARMRSRKAFGSLAIASAPRSCVARSSSSAGRIPLDHSHIPPTVPASHA